ncbi:hypothetical protein ACR78Z_07830 [Sphingobacterium thalpophilum]|uniref:YD repeat-containing protein n=1 Tax=Sphingobacterium thalpophilum TaxID=259 RepID=A0A4U9UVG7_9SPHI|nr:hypothetical protein [Sphingobacterium thalpophilum]VTR37945.1 Uncharacterised protein [Sphingobacterium thalpophilum]
MKYFVYILLFGSLFIYSCQKDKNGKGDSRLVLLKVAQQSGQSFKQTTYAFQYDDQGRLIKLNDELFHYGANGRVDYSRIAFKGQMNGMNSERIVRLSYHWDEQRRLTRVVLDSLYIKQSPMSGGVSSTGTESLLKGIVLSTYSYASGLSVPTKIIFRKWKIPYQEIEREEEVTYVYQGDNIQQSKGFLSVTSFPDIPANYTLNLTAFQFYQYATTVNPLHPIYRQMGFNPVDINQAVSKNLPNAFFGSLVEGWSESEAQPDWTKKTDVNLTLDAGGKATAMDYVLKGDFEELKNVTFGALSLNYVYE